MAFTIAFRLVEEFHHMGRKAIYIERYEKAHRIHVGEQSQNFLKILPTAEGHHLLSGAPEETTGITSRRNERHRLFSWDLHSKSEGS